MASTLQPNTAHFRAHERRLVDLDASIWHVGGIEQVPVHVTNLGLGGAGVVCSSPLRVEDRVMFSVLSPVCTDPIVLPSRVAWSGVLEPAGEPRAGLCFEIPDRAPLFALFQLIGTLTVDE